MDKERLDEIMFDSAAKTIESMAFTEVLPSEDDVVEDGSEYAVALSVEDPCPGRFRMIMPKELLCFISEAMLALPRDEIDEKTLIDFLLELLNTITGSFLRMYLKGDIKLKLGLPEVISGEESREKWPLIWNFSAEESIFSIAASEEMLEYFKG